MIYIDRPLLLRNAVLFGPILVMALWGIVRDWRRERKQRGFDVIERDK